MDRVHGGWSTSPRNFIKRGSSIRRYVAWIETTKRYLGDLISGVEKKPMVEILLTQRAILPSNQERPLRDGRLPALTGDRRCTGDDAPWP
jgi:hypothetical protein